MSDDVSQRKDNWIRVESKSWLFGEGVILISEYVKNSTEQFRIFHRLIISSPRQLRSWILIFSVSAEYKDGVSFSNFLDLITG